MTDEQGAATAPADELVNMLLDAQPVPLGEMKLLESRFLAISAMVLAMAEELDLDTAQRIGLRAKQLCETSQAAADSKRSPLDVLFGMMMAAAEEPPPKEGTDG